MKSGSRTDGGGNANVDVGGLRENGLPKVIRMNRAKRNKGSYEEGREKESDRKKDVLRGKR